MDYIDIPIDSEVAALFDSVTVSVDMLRSSQTLSDFLRWVTEKISRNRLVQSWGIQSIDARLDAISHMLIAELCTPQLFDLFGRPDVDRAKRIMMESFTLFRMTEELLVNPG